MSDGRKYGFYDGPVMPKCFNAKLSSDERKRRECLRCTYASIYHGFNSGICKELFPTDEDCDPCCRQDNGGGSDPFKQEWERIRRRHQGSGGISGCCTGDVDDDSGNCCNCGRDNITCPPLPFCGCACSNRNGQQGGGGGGQGGCGGGNSGGGGGGGCCSCGGGCCGSSGCPPRCCCSQPRCCCGCCPPRGCCQSCCDCKCGYCCGRPDCCCQGGYGCGCCPCPCNQRNQSQNDDGNNDCGGGGGGRDLSAGYSDQNFCRQQNFRSCNCPMPSCRCSKF